VVALTLISAFAQSTNNQEVNGTVQDPTGSVVSGANVTVTNPGTNFARTAITNENGHFVVANLPIGVYNVSAEAKGFKKLLMSKLELSVDAKLAVTLKLEIGALTDSVTVQADAAQIETTTGEVGRLITGEQATQLQLNGRNFPQLLAIVPGVSTTYSSGFGLFGGYGVNNSGQSANGGRTDTFSWNLDGADNKDNGGGGNNFVNINPDAITEFKMLTTNYSAEYGNSAGAVVNLMLKSGSKQFHGVAYEYFRNDAIRHAPSTPLPSPNSASTISDGTSAAPSLFPNSSIAIAKSCSSSSAKISSASAKEPPIPGPFPPARRSVATFRPLHSRAGPKIRIPGSPFQTVLFPSARSAKTASDSCKTIPRRTSTAPAATTSSTPLRL